MLWLMPFGLGFAPRVWQLLPFFLIKLIQLFKVMHIGLTGHNIVVIGWLYVGQTCRTFLDKILFPSNNLSLRIVVISWYLRTKLISEIKLSHFWRLFFFFLNFCSYFREVWFFSTYLVVWSRSFLDYSTWPLDIFRRKHCSCVILHQRCFSEVDWLDVLIILTFLLESVVTAYWLVFF